MLTGQPNSATMLAYAAPGALRWPAAVIAWGRGFVSAKHKHHSVQLVMAFEGSLRIRGGPIRRWIHCGGALVRSDTPHEVDASESQALFAFVDPESDLGTAVGDNLVEDITPLKDAVVELWRKQLGDPVSLTSDRVEAWLRKSLLSKRRMPRLNPKVRRVLRVIGEDLGTPRRLSLKRLASIAGLSESRFMHLFTESLGVPLRPYILWRRMQRACGEMMKGVTVTQAAYLAGFADAAHLSRTVKRMMGTTLTDLVYRRRVNRAAFASDFSMITSCCLPPEV